MLFYGLHWTDDRAPADSDRGANVLLVVLATADRNRNPSLAREILTTSRELHIVHVFVTRQLAIARADRTPRKAVLSSLLLVATGDSLVPRL
jgi:hypothetical protein